MMRGAQVGLERGVCCAFILSILALFGGPTPAGAVPDDRCQVVDNGAGTIDFPPESCSYLATNQLYMIIDGLPPGTTIEIEPVHSPFFCSTGPSSSPCLVESGGNLGGDREVFDSHLVLDMRGTGDLDGFHRIVAFPTAMETHTAPRTPGDPVQAFDADLFLMSGLLLGDPDFGILQLTAGTTFGFPSPGHTTLTDLGTGRFHVDSFFDIAYQITFEGAPGGALEGLSGVTGGIVRVQAFGERDSCVADDDGTGTAEVPPPSCDLLAPSGSLVATDGLPPGSTLVLEPQLTGLTGAIVRGSTDLFDGTLVLQVAGTGSLSSFRRTLRLPSSVSVQNGPRVAGDPAQTFETELISLSSSLLPGDPDFANLVVTAGSASGLPSPGVSTLRDLGDGTFQVDSFFDVEYRIDFEGAPGGALEGLSGSTTSTARIETRAGAPVPIEPDDGSGTATLPPEGGHYTGRDAVYMILDGLPPGTEIALIPSHRSFACTPQPCSLPGGVLGGTTEAFDMDVYLELEGAGSLAGFQRTLTVPVAAQTASGPRTPASPVQGFDTEMVALEGSISGDPDFAELTIVAGADNGLPSPGHTTLTDLGGGDFQVDSFFDIEYQITFFGAPGGSLDGLSGTTQGALRITAEDRPDAPARNLTIEVEAAPTDPVDFSFSGFASFLLDDDADPTLGSFKTFSNMAYGSHVVTQTFPPGWVVLSISCNDPDGGTTADPLLGTATVDVDPGESIHCLFRNVPEADLVFADGFESGNTSRWSSAVSP